MVTKEEIIEALKSCFDPELQIDVWTLGLIYDISIMNAKDVKIKMTFTTPMCPYGPLLMDEVYRALKNIKDTNKVKIDITFDPPWKPSDELRAMMGI
jgi:metal-sulfur cluster biosynthetic enzyme